MLTTAQIELRTRAVAERVGRKEPVEDHHVEVKTKWPDDPSKAARQIAGHANSACPEEILWVIGLNERTSEVPGASANEFSNWWARVAPCFDGLAPSYRELVVPFNEVQLVAILFETDRAPYVVKNPAFGTPNSGPISSEVPWRLGQSTRTATRAQLLQLLAEPPSRYPDIEIVKAALTLKPPPEEPDQYARFRDLETPSPAFFISAVFSAHLYLTPLGSQKVVFPFHRSLAEIHLGGQRYVHEALRLAAAPEALSVSASNRSSAHELILVQPGFVDTYWSQAINGISSEDAGEQATIVLRLHAVLAPKPLTFEIPLTRSSTVPNTFSYSFP